MGWMFRADMQRVRTGDSPAYKGGVSYGRNGRPAGKCGSSRSARNVVGSHGQHTVLHAAQKPLRVICFDAQFGIIYPQYAY